MIKSEFKKVLASGFQVGELLSWFEIKCWTCHARWAISKRVVRDPRFGVVRLLNQRKAAIEPRSNGKGVESTQAPRAIFWIASRAAPSATRTFSLGTCPRN